MGRPQISNNMKTSDKLLTAFNEFRPHIQGHNTAMDLFLEAVSEVQLLESTLRLEEPYSLEAILEKLTEASKILLIDKSYDGHGWELIKEATVQAENAIKHIKTPIGIKVDKSKAVHKHPINEVVFKSDAMHSISPNRKVI